MKFQVKYPDAQISDKFEFEYSHVTKTSQLGTCKHCQAMTKWIDVLFQVPVCSEECGSILWHNYRENEKDNYYDFDAHFEYVKQELKWAEGQGQVTKDILVVVRDQLRYVQECLETVEANTDNYTLYVWDNGSGPDTADYLKAKEKEYLEKDDPRRRMKLVRKEDNIGFIVPNNELARMGDGDYIILLNSDCKVFEKWADAMVGFLRNNPEVAEVGFWGGYLDHEGRGFGGNSGYDVDYIPGWGLCISRETYREFGLFDDANFQFAYSEDADLSLTLKQAGKKVYALHAPLVHHYQNKTIETVAQEIDAATTFEHNHQVMLKKWADYLANDRVALKEEIKSYGKCR